MQILCPLWSAMTWFVLSFLPVGWHDAQIMAKKMQLYELQISFKTAIIESHVTSDNHEFSQVCHCSVDYSLTITL